jgi:3-methylfumaryl-CoA hydratase
MSLMTTAPDLTAFQSWLDHRDTATELLSVVPAHGLAATLNLPAASVPSEALPPLWHWLHFLDRTPSAQLADDGSPRMRALLPPIPLDQIMWAGSEIDFIRPLRLNEAASRQSRILDMTGKSGSRGPMVFLTTEHRVEQRGEVAIVERNRAVFLGAAAPVAAPAAFSRRPAERDRTWQVDEAVLFRFSALTFNSHRIHYDLPYATQVGGYPALVVHGPLQAILLAETFREWFPDRPVSRIEFRAKGSLFCGEPLVVGGAPRGHGSYALWTTSPRAECAMECVVSHG